MESSPTEKWLLKIYGCGLPALISGDAYECVLGNRGREPLGTVRLGSGVGGHIPLLNMLRFH